MICLLYLIIYKCSFSISNLQNKNMIHIIFGVACTILPFFCDQSEQSTVVRQHSEPQVQQIEVARTPLPSHEILKEYKGADWLLVDILLENETVFTVDDERLREIALLFYERDTQNKHYHRINYGFYTTVEARTANISPIAYGSDPSIYEPLIACGYIGSFNVEAGKHTITMSEGYDRTGCSREVPKRMSEEDVRKMLTKVYEIERNLHDGTFAAAADCFSVTYSEQIAACVEMQTIANMLEQSPEKIFSKNGMFNNPITEKKIKRTAGKCKCLK